MLVAIKGHLEQYLPIYLAIDLRDADILVTRTESRSQACLQLDTQVRETN